MKPNLRELEDLLGGVGHDVGIAVFALKQYRAGTMSAEKAMQHILEGIGSAAALLDIATIHARRIAPEGEPPRRKTSTQAAACQDKCHGSEVPS